MNSRIDLQTCTLQKQFSSLSARLSFLLERTGLHEAEFARRTGIKQQICNQILRGQTENPRLDTVIKLAGFFNVSVGQLIGTEPMEVLRRGGATSAIPLLEWNDVVEWVEKEELPENGKSAHWISSELPLKNRAYAIRSNPILEPHFDRNSVLLIDPSLEYRPGHFIVAGLNSRKLKTITVRRLVEELGDIFLNSIVPGIPSIQLNSQLHLLGTVVEVRQSQVQPQHSIAKGKSKL